mgnify:CR=1 FL=1
MGKKLREHHVGSLVLRGLMYLAAGITVVALLYVLFYILVNGVPALFTSKGIFSTKYNSENVSLLPSLINTLILTAVSLAIAIPLGIGAAIYLSEYAKKRNFFVRVIELMSETLSGIPSIIYGLFGMIFFVVFLKWDYSLMAGAATAAIMVLPTILSTTKEALDAVPDSYREGSFALGTGKLRTIFKVVLPAAVPGILSGIILAIGRIVGETAALLYTSGSASGLANGLMSSGRTLAIHMYVLANEGLHTDQAWATAVVLLVLVLLINTLSAFIAKKLTSKNK